MFLIARIGNNEYDCKSQSMNSIFKHIPGSTSPAKWQELSRLIAKSAEPSSGNPIKVVGRSITGAQRWDYRSPPWVEVTRGNTKKGDPKPLRLQRGGCVNIPCTPSNPPPSVVVVILLKAMVPRDDHYLMVVPVFSLLSLGGNNE
ncbi:hypothetical protein CDAR_17681 [Caerostris darwini]|uniref:Uncharacterized protein n=1 Tax=Caerostris darwini TaxID=1538125 RepID=A0AAV4MD97_9ARAC|nr:hypothetical protein CDAR_17681 [Caerostris darwini]